MKFFLDTTKKQLVKSTASNVALDRLVLKRRDSLAVEVAFVARGAVATMPAGTTTTVALKKTFADANFLALASGTPATLDLNTVPLESAFSASPASISALLEIRWSVPGETTRTATLAVEIQNSVILGTEATPEALPDGKATQTEATTGTDNTKWMTPLRTAQAIAVLAPPPTTDASLLTSGTLADARLSATAAASLAKADTASQPGHAHDTSDIASASVYFDIADSHPSVNGSYDVWDIDANGRFRWANLNAAAEGATWTALRWNANRWELGTYTDFTTWTTLYFNPSTAIIPPPTGWQPLALHPAGTIFVSGAGTPATNGTYTPSGTRNGKNQYSNGTVSLYWESDYGGRWRFDNFYLNGGGNNNSAGVTTNTPPATGWWIAVGGSPAPTVTPAPALPVLQWFSQPTADEITSLHAEDSRLQKQLDDQGGINTAAIQTLSANTSASLASLASADTALGQRIDYLAANLDQTALDSIAEAAASIGSLQTQINGKANATHPHTAADITDFAAAVTSAAPSLAITSTTHIADGLTDTYSANGLASANPSHVIVTLNGVLQAPSIDYSVNLASGTIVFDGYPSAGQQIVFTALGLRSVQPPIDPTLYLYAFDISANGLTTYSGRLLNADRPAAPALPETASTWTIKRTTLNAAGRVLSTASAIGSWANRETLAYA